MKREIMVDRSGDLLALKPYKATDGKQLLWLDINQVASVELSRDEVGTLINNLYRWYTEERNG